MLQSAEQVLASIPPPRSKFKKQRAVKPDYAVVCGSTVWDDRKKMKTILSKLDVKNTRIVTGTSKGAEIMAVSVAKELGFVVIQMHPQMQFGHNSAIHLRNHLVFNIFKPTRVVGFHKNIEVSVSTASYLKIGKSKGAVCQLIDNRPPKKKKVVK